MLSYECLLMAVAKNDLSTQDAGLVAGELLRVVKEEQRLREEVSEADPEEGG